MLQKVLCLVLPLGPLILTVSWPAPAPLVSTMKRLTNVARIPCSTPGPVTLTLLASGWAVTLMIYGLPAMMKRVFLSNLNLVPGAF